MRPAFSRAHEKFKNFRVVETRRDVTTFSLETLRVANQAGSGSLVVVKEFRESAARRSGLFTTRGVRARPVRALCRVAKV